MNWKDLFEGYQAIVDFPGYRYYQELMQYYPDAKVILTIRNPETWYESALTPSIKRDQHWGKSY